MAKRTEETTAKKGTTPREVVPEFFSSDTGEGVATIDPSPRFVFAHHRKRWTIVDGRVVPELSKIPLVSGSNRITIDPKTGRVRFADTQAMFQDRHFKIVPPNLAPNNRSYLQEVDTVHDSKIVPAVISVWETAHAGEEHTEWDYASYADWLESLVANGHVAPVTQHRASEMLKAARALLRRAELKLAQNKAGSPDRVETLRAEVSAWERATKGPKGAPVKAKPAALDLDDAGAA